MAVIETMGLSKRYKDNWAVDHLDLRVEQGDIYGFIGRNGAGKSTTLKLLCGLARPTQGEALIFGKPIRDSVARRRVGALIEQPGLYPDLSGRENLRLYAALLGLDSPVGQTTMHWPQETQATSPRSCSKAQPMWVLKPRSLGPMTPTACHFWQAATHRRQRTHLSLSRNMCLAVSSKSCWGFSPA